MICQLARSKNAIDLETHLSIATLGCTANDTKIDQEGKLIGDPTETAFVQYAL